MAIESNIFPIIGMDALSAHYRLYRIVGLPAGSPDHYANLQRLIRRLSFSMKAPVTTIEREGDNYLLVPTGFANPPSNVTLVGCIASLEDAGEGIDIDFAAKSDQLDAVRLRFLQFMIQAPLHHESDLWQPGAGQPFFSKKPSRSEGPLQVFEGYAVRVVKTPDEGFALCVDLRTKLVWSAPLSRNASRKQINALKGRSCLYRMGHQWFEVKLHSLADYTVSQPSIPFDGKKLNLIEYLNQQCRKPAPPELANLSPSGPAIFYTTNGPSPKAAPAELCYLVEDTHGFEGARNQRHTIVRPDARHEKIHAFVEKYLRSLKLGNVTLSVSNQAVPITTRPFSVPDLLFGNGSVLSISSQHTKDKTQIDALGQARRRLLEDKKAGFYSQTVLPRQYVMLPTSILNSAGPTFVDHLRAQVLAMYPQGGGYEPEVIAYDDLSAPRDFVGQGRAILSAAQAHGMKAGYVVVMVHRYKRGPRKTDQLTAMIVKEFPERFGTKASIIHTDMIRDAYEYRDSNGSSNYTIRVDMENRFAGYLRNVALNKVLLTNGKNPFVLNSSTHADAIIGIDVKNNTAAFTFFAEGGRIIRSEVSRSKQKEQLLAAQVKKFTLELIKKESAQLSRPLKHIVVHRDGRAWSEEIAGLRSACEALAKEGVIDAGWSLTVLEIAKSAPAPIRLFDCSARSNGDRLRVENPRIGNWVQLGDTDGYLSTTGRPFTRQGTSNPLHIRRAEGPMPLAHCLDDVFALSCLAWTRPEDCSRVPLSIKLCDLLLFDDAAEYDEDALAFGDSTQGEIAT